MKTAYHEKFINGEEYKLYSNFIVDKEWYDSLTKEEKLEEVYKDINENLSIDYADTCLILLNIDEMPKEEQIKIKEILLKTSLVKYLNLGRFVVDYNEVKKNDLFKRFKGAEDFSEEEKEQFKYQFIEEYMNMYISALMGVQNVVSIDISKSVNCIAKTVNRKIELTTKVMSQLKKMDKRNGIILEDIQRKVYPKIRELMNKNERAKESINKAVVNRINAGDINEEILDEILKNGLVKRECMKKEDVDKIISMSTVDELAQMIEYGSIIQEDVEEYINPKEIIENNRKKKAQDRIKVYKLISDKTILNLYITKEILIDDLKNRELNIMQMFENNELYVKDLIELKNQLLLEKNFNKVNKILSSFPKKEDIVRLVKEDKLTMDEMMGLDEIGLCDLNYIVEVYEQKSEINETEKTKLRDICSFEKIEEEIKKENWELISFIKINLLEPEEIDSVDKLICKEKNYHEKIALHKQGIISEKILKEELLEIDILEEHEKKQISFDELIYLYNMGICSLEDLSLIIGEENAQDKIVESYNNEEISLNGLKDINDHLKEMNEDIDIKLIEHLEEEGKLDKEDSLFDLYIIGILDIQKIKQYYAENKINDDLIQKQCLDGRVNKEKLQELYYHGLIGSIFIDKLVENEIITKKEAVNILKTATVEHIVSEVLEAEITDVAGSVEAIFSKNGEQEYNEDSDYDFQNNKRTNKNHTIIDPRIRHKYIKRLGFTSRIEQKEKTFLKGYELYYNPDTDMIIAEALFTEKANQVRYAYGQATYIFHINQIPRMITSSKTDIIKDIKTSDVEIRRTDHYHKKWAQKLQNNLEELEGKRKSKYNQSEIAELENSIKTPEQEQELAIIAQEIAEGMYNINDER